jgi:hypothetical protein
MIGMLLELSVVGATSLFLWNLAQTKQSGVIFGAMKFGFLDITGISRLSTPG